jgi:hypothetical protein
MTQRDQFEEQLAQLTRWEEPSLGLWEKALEQEQKPRPGTRTFLFRIPRHQMAAAALILIATLVGVMIVMPSLSRATRMSSVPLREQLAADGRFVDPAQRRAVEGMVAWAENSDLPARTAASVVAPADPIAGAPARAGGFDDRGRAQQAAPARHIIRRITMELHAKDVRATFAHALLIPSVARGEYVQSSSLIGEGDQAQAELTLRIAADRLDDALNELRTLGTVHTERATGDDVTAQVVDLDARLRNEQRIETELLQLLDKRTDSPLAEVLQVRRSLDDVRQRIEQLQGQRQHLQRQVSLATILLILRPPPADDEPPAPAGAILDYFKDSIIAAWQTGVHFLADSLGFLLTLLIGGLVWWLALIAAATAWVHHRRRTIMRGLA